jgi:hypothetical protein
MCDDKLPVACVGWLCYNGDRIAVSHGCLHHERGTYLGGDVPCSLSADLQTYYITSLEFH